MNVELSPSLKKQNNRNIVLTWIRDTLYGIATTLASTSVIEGFLLYAQMDADKIGFWLSFSSIASLVASVLLTGFASATNKVVRYNALAHIGMGVITLGYAVMALLSLSAGGLYAMLLGIAGLLSITTALRNVFEYKQPCEVIALDQYAKVIAGSGLLSSAFGIALGIVITRLYVTFEFVHTTVALFISSAVVYILSGLVNWRMKSIHPPKENEVHPKMTETLSQLAHNRDFRMLALPNFIRGFGNAFLGLVAVMAVKWGILEETECAVVTTLTSVGAMISSLLYLPMIKWLTRARSIFVGSCLFALCFPAFLSGNKWVFYILYAIAYFGMNVLSAGIPDLVYQHIPAEIISPFQVWRITLLTGGTTLGSYLFGLLLQYNTAPVLVLSIGVGATLICGAGYRIYYASDLKKNREAEEK